MPALLVLAQTQRKRLRLPLHLRLRLQLQLIGGQCQRRQGLQHDIAACVAALQIVFDDVSDGVARVVTAIDLTVAITQAVCIQLDNASETGVVLRRQDQMEIAFQPIRRYRLQVKMQGVAAIKTSRLGQLLILPQPGDLHFRQVAAVIRQDIYTHRPVYGLVQTDGDFLASKKSLPCAQAQHAIDQLPLLRHETAAVQLPPHAHLQLGLRLGGQPAQAEYGSQPLGIAAGQQRQPDH